MKSFFNKKYTFLYGLIFGIVLMYSLLELRNICTIGMGNNALMNQVIQKLSRQAARWSTAAKQDHSPLIAVLHANYGAGYTWALQDIATPQQIKIATGIDWGKFTKEIVTVQDEATLNMVRVCPKFAPEKTYLASIGGENI